MWKNNIVGFSLLELIIVIVIIALLAVISASEYQHFIRKNHRSDAQTSLLHHHAHLQRCYLQKYNYALCIENFGLQRPQPSFSHFYLIQSLEYAEKAYILQATAQNEQTKDTACYRFTINETQKIAAYESAGKENLKCWGK